MNTTIEHIPAEIIVQILEITHDVHSIACFSATCKNYHDYVKEPLIWRWLLRDKNKFKEFSHEISNSKSSKIVMRILRSNTYCRRFRIMFNDSCIAVSKCLLLREILQKIVYIPYVYTLNDIKRIVERCCIKNNIEIINSYLVVNMSDNSYADAEPYHSKYDTLDDIYKTMCSNWRICGFAYLVISKKYSIRFRKDIKLNKIDDMRARFYNSNSIASHNTK